MRCRRDNPALQSRMTCFPAFRPIESRASISPASVAGRRVPGGGHGRRRCLLRAVVPGRFDDEQHGDDDCQRPQHPRGPEQRTLTGRKRAPRRPVTTRGRAGSTGCRSPASRVGRDPGCRTRRNGRRGGPARGGCLAGPRGPAAGAHRCHRVGERSPTAIAHRGVLHQSYLDEFSHIGRQVGRQRRRRLLDVLHCHGQGTIAGERPFTRNRFIPNNSQ